LLIPAMIALLMICLCPRGCIIWYHSLTVISPPEVHSVAVVVCRVETRNPCQNCRILGDDWWFPLLDRRGHTWPGLQVPFCSYDMQSSTYFAQQSTRRFSPLMARESPKVPLHSRRLFIQSRLSTTIMYKLTIVWFITNYFTPDAPYSHSYALLLEESDKQRPRL
jgi:hypothetical protein